MNIVPHYAFGNPGCRNDRYHAAYSKNTFDDRTFHTTSLIQSFEPISKVLAFFVDFYFSCAVNLFYGTRIDFLLKKV